MSARTKRQLSKAGGSVEAGGTAPSAGARKKRRLDNSGSEDEERSVWTPKHLGDLRAYNRSASEAPAELFRKDLISAMKLADNEPLTTDDYWGIGDPWKQEWERGVQVPVNPDSLPEPAVTTTIARPKPEREGSFRLTKDKFIRVNHDDFFSNETHILSNLPTKAEKMCRYDMDDLDDKWLLAYNGERARMGAAPVPALIFEMIMEHLEETCWENIHKLLKTEESLSIEFDEDVICDVCRSPDSEEGNEMVFCDSCNICVHQACYGITAIPSGSWLCRTCSLGIKPDCQLCPNKGGAMKSTKSGLKWAHVACALWIPEVSIGSVDRMEPITKIPNIPQSRWALVCVLCRERRGACIQCSVKTCKTAYHVTCAFKHVLEMKAIIEDENADDGVKLRSYCEKHNLTSKKVGCEESDAEEGAPNKKRDRTSEQKNQARAAKLRQIESEFYKHVDVLETSNFLDIDFETTETIFNYWKLKRRAGFNKPLLTPRSEEIDLLSHQQEHDIERMKMFVQLRQYLERVRNLCYMVSRRERLSRSYLKVREQTFSKQVALVGSGKLAAQVVEAVVQANHGPSVYDQMYSHHAAPTHSHAEFEKIVACIAGTLTEKMKSTAKKEPVEKKDVNGLIRLSKDKSDNPYKKMYVNGAEQRRSRSSSMYSTSDSESSMGTPKWPLPPKGSTRYSVYTSSEEDTNKENHSLKHESPQTKSKLAFLDTSDKEKPKDPVGRAARGRVGRRRGAGRANAVKKQSAKEVSHVSSEEDVKDFDSLMSSKAVKTEPNATSSKNPRTALDTSDDEAEPATKAKPQPRRRNKRKVTPPKVESCASSEDEPMTPAAADKKAAQRKGSKWVRAGAAAVSPKREAVSEDDDLAPATYKLSSDDDNSDKSHDPAAASDIFGVSDRTDSSSDNGQEKALSKGPKKSDKKNESLLSDSEANSDDERESTNDSQNHATLKTKAAKKEFTPKIEARLERINKKKVARPNKKAQDKPKPEVKVEEAEAEPKGEADAAPQLFVPQRKAAKKASELITSQNTTAVSGAAPPAAPLLPEVPEAKKTSNKVKEVKEDLDTSDAPEDRKVAEDKKAVEEKKTVEEKKVTPSKGRRGKNAKDKAEEKGDDAPKKNLFEPPEILPYVPMRQAARKAAENLKGGNKAGAAPPTEEPEPTPAPPQPSPTKAKRISRVEAKAGLRAKSKSPRAAKPMSSTVSDSGSESDSEKLTKSIFSDSDDDSVFKKTKSDKEKLEAIPDKRFFRGDIYLRPYQSSSDENEDGRPATPGRKSLLARTAADHDAKNQSFRDSSISGDLHTSDSDQREDENQEPAAGAHRKAPDKKLKTSEGRPEHGFQPPVTERSESRVSDAEEPGSDASAARGEAGLESRLRQGGPQCRPRAAAGDVAVQDVTSNADAPPRGRRRGREREPGAAPPEAKQKPTRREIQLEEKLKSSKKTPERSGQEKSGASRRSVSSEKEEAVRRDTSRGSASEDSPVKDAKKDLVDKVAFDRDRLRSPGERRSGASPSLQDAIREAAAAKQHLNQKKDPLRDEGVSRDKLLSPRDRAFIQGKRDVSPREKVLSPRDRTFSPRDKLLSPREREMPVLNAILPSRENKDADKVRESAWELDVSGKERRDGSESDSMKDQVGAKPNDCFSDARESLEKSVFEFESKDVEASDQREPFKFNLSTETDQMESEMEKEQRLRLPLLSGDGKASAKVDDSGKSEKKMGVFGYVDGDVEVSRLADIEDASDPEPEPKKVRVDSDEERGEKRVEQPQDSGYKSAITTPEPVDKLHAACNDVNNLVNNYLSEEVDATSKAPVLLPNPVDSKHPLNKFISPTKKKNLEDVIGEMKRQAEAQPDVQPDAQPEPASPQPTSPQPASPLPASPLPASPLPASPLPASPLPASPQLASPQPAEHQPETLDSPRSQPNSFSTQQPETSAASSSSSGASADSLQTPKSASSTVANFREQWRGQWEKSPPREHKVEPGPPLSIPGLDMGLNPMLAMYQDSQHAQHPQQAILDLFNRARQMQHFNQLYNFPYLQQPGAPDLLYPPAARDNQMPDKNMCAQEMSRLPLLDDRPMSDDPAGADAQPGNRAAASAGKAAKPLPSPGSLGAAVSQQPSPITPGGKVAPDMMAAIAGRGAVAEQLSPALPHAIPQPQPSPSSLFAKNDLLMTSSAQPLATSLAEGSPGGHTVLSPNKTLTQADISPQSSKSSQPSSLQTQSTKSAEAPAVSLGSSASLPHATKGAQATAPSTALADNSVTITKVSRPLISPTRNSIVNSKLSTSVAAPLSPLPSAKSAAAAATTSLSTAMKSPLPSVTSPASVHSNKDTPLHIATEVPDSKIETITVDDSTPQRRDEPQPKRVPIYMQEAKPHKAAEKKSPRSQASSPRWSNKESTKSREKKAAKGRGQAYNRGRGRSAGKGKGRGQSPRRFNSVSVPKELVGTVYDFDFDNEFDDGPANNTLDDLRKSREKRQSVDTTPQQSLTPTYTLEHKEPPPKKSSKKAKSSAKEKAAAKTSEADDNVAKIIEDYRNMQNSQLRRSTHSPSPPHEDAVIDVLPPASPEKVEEIQQYTSEYTSSISENKLTISTVSEVRDADPSPELSEQKNPDDSKAALAVPTAQIGIDERTNQLKLKIKGPYANSYSTSSVTVAPPEAVGAPTPASSTTSTLRRMRKKELIRQYCYQDQMPAEPPESGPIASTPNPPPHVRTGITIPKAVASMPSIPTREDYKMYTQDDTPSGEKSRRKRPPRELRLLDWPVMDESGKRNSETGEGGDTRKRARAAKDAVKSLEEKDVSSAKPPPKLRISLGKKGSEVTTVTSESKDVGGKQRPPKKRHAEENAMVKIMNDNMKFREQIMADFDKGDKKGTKGSDREKKTKKRKVVAGDSAHGSSAEDNHDIKVITGDNSNAPKLVIRFGKGKSDTSGGKAKCEFNSSGSLKEEKSDSDSTLNPSLKIRLSVPKSEPEPVKEESPVAKVPLKLKLSRRFDGYVASNTPRKLEADEQDQGPGPPAPKPPDLPQEFSLEKSCPGSSKTSPTPSSPAPLMQQQQQHQHHQHQPFMQKEQQQQSLHQSQPLPMHLQHSQPQASLMSHCAVNEPLPHHESGMSMSGNLPHPLGPYDAWPPAYPTPDQLGPQMDYGMNSLGAAPRQECPEEMLQRLEAQIAAAGRGVAEGGGAASSIGPRDASGTPLPDVPSLRHTLYPYKEGSDCR